MSTDATRQLLTSHRLDRGARPRRAEAKELNVIFDHRWTFLSKEGEDQVYNLVVKGYSESMVDAGQVKLEETVPLQTLYTAGYRLPVPSRGQCDYSAFDERSQQWLKKLERSK